MTYIQSIKLTRHIQMRFSYTEPFLNILHIFLKRSFFFPTGWSVFFLMPLTRENILWL